MHKSITSVPFPVHSWPSPLLGKTPSSEDPETSVPPSWVLGLEGIRRACQWPLHHQVQSLTPHITSFSFPLPPVHSPFLCCMFLKDKWYAYMTGANGCQFGVISFHRINQSPRKTTPSRNSIFFAVFQSLYPHYTVPMLGLLSQTRIPMPPKLSAVGSWGIKKMATTSFRPSKLAITEAFPCSFTGFHVC